MVQEQQLGKYDLNNREWSQMFSMYDSQGNNNEYLGSSAAEKEWEDDPKLASKQFIHIDAYHNFVDEDALILLGRTGTGKTSILKSIEYSIKNKKCKKYTDVILDEFDELFEKLLEQPSNMNDKQIMSQMEEIIDVTIITMVMLYVVEKNPNSEKLKCVRRYIEEHNLRPGSKIKNVIGRFLLALKSTSENPTSRILNSVADIYTFINEQLNTEYENAKNELIEFLKDKKDKKEKKLLIIFDSMNEYNVNEKNEILAVKSLISVCFKYYISNKTTNIYFKIALPSEVYNRVLESLPGKQQGNTTMIQWQYKQLINFAALRVWIWSQSRKAKRTKLDLSFANEYKFKDFISNDGQAYDNAKKFLSKIYGEFRLSL